MAANCKVLPLWLRTLQILKQYVFKTTNEAKSWKENNFKTLKTQEIHIQLRKCRLLKAGRTYWEVSLDVCPICIFSLGVSIIEWVGLEGIIKIIYLQPPCHRQRQLLLKLLKAPYQPASGKGCWICWVFHLNTIFSLMVSHSH